MTKLRRATHSPRLPRRLFALAAGGLMVTGFALTGAGCGGSGGGTNSGSASVTKPSDTTRARVKSLHELAFRNLSQSGYQSASWAASRYGGYGGGFGGDVATPYPAPAPSPGANEGSTAVGSGGGAAVPLVGSFLKNVAAVPPAKRAARTRLEPPREPAPEPTQGPDGPPVWQNDSFYFDYYLGLWVQVSSEASRTTYTLWEDEAKTKPAGSITTSQPTSYDAFPQVYESEYAFTAGYLSGSHGRSRNVTNADYSGSSEYENVYSDGWKESGSSSWDARGGYSWTSRTDTADGKWVENQGGFRGDGGGGTRTKNSEGYQADYTYNRDGSGRGRITGNDPGMPVTISWDAYGNTTVQYADGTVETWRGWGGYYYGGGYGGYPMPTDTPVVWDEGGLPAPPSPSPSSAPAETPPVPGK